MLVATVSFAVSLWYSHSLLQPLDVGAQAITENSLPSVEYLAQARIDLLRVGTQLQRALSARDAALAVAAKQLGVAQRDLSADVQRYRQLPNSPQEQRLLRELDGDLVPLNAAIAATLGRGAQPHNPDGSLTAAAAVLERLERLNANEALSSANHILLLRRHTARVATLLGAVSLAVAALVLVLALMVLREQARVMHAHAALLKERGAELEAFAGRVAHDLRDPLAAMTFGIRAASKSTASDELGHQTLELIGRQITAMNDTIDGLLEFARAGATAMPAARAALAEVVDEVIATLQPKAAAAQTELHVEPFEDVQVACTPAALRSIVANLLGNAVKYIVESREARRRIDIRVSERDDMTRVEIADNGPGLPPGAEEHIFEPFRRVGATRQPGIGLGLATVKKILEAYRGRVGVISRPGQGSTFWFEIPTASARLRPQ